MSDVVVTPITLGERGTRSDPLTQEGAGKGASSTDLTQPASLAAGAPSSGRRLESLEAAVERRGAEIDYLQVELAKRAQPFYRKPSTVIATLALVASIVSIFVTYKSSNDDRAIEMRGRLTTVMQIITDSHSKNAELRVQYGVRAPIVTDVDTRPAIDEGAYLADQLESTPYKASPAEKNILAEGYLDANDPDQAMKYAARLFGQGAFESAQVPQGEAAMTRSEQYVVNATDVDDQLKDITLWNHYLAWANLELRAGNCPAARLHANQAAVESAKLAVPYKGNTAAGAATESAWVQQQCNL